jgi:ribonucleoside-diphosphate reductase alpha chain
MRNATVTTIAPTGTISMIAGCSQSIEPLFSLAPFRSLMGNMQALETNRLLIEEIRKRGINAGTIIQEVARTGSIQNISGIPRDLKRIFVTALEITPKWHIRVQSAFQRYTDNAVSKTVNMPFDATIEDVRSSFLLAHELRCKGVTVYRDGSRSKQVVYSRAPASKKCQCL